ncbi:MAG: histidine phosphatase family protein, partial [bacterium]
GKKLKEIKVLPDLVISSPAKRAIKTATMIAKEIGFPKNKIEQNIKIYENSSRVIVEIVRSIDGKFEHAMLCGHNPSITDLSYFLTDNDVANIPTCGVVMIGLPVDSWKEVMQGIGKLLSFDYPKKYY